MTNIGPNMDGWKWDALKARVGSMVEIWDMGKAETIVDPGFCNDSGPSSTEAVRCEATDVGKPQIDLLNDPSVLRWMYNRCLSLYLSVRDRGWS